MRTFETNPTPPTHRDISFELCSSHHLLKSEASEAFWEGSEEGVGRRLVGERGIQRISFLDLCANFEGPVFLKKNFEQH